MSNKIITVSSTIPTHAAKVFTGKFFEIYQWPQELYDGSIVTFERAKRPHTAGVIAITPDKKILVTEQEQPLHAPFWGMLGGVVDPGEEPLEAAQRELLEESGYASQEWQFWFAAQPSSRIEWVIHTYVAYEVQKIQEAKPEAGEKIKVHAVQFEEFLTLVQQDNFRDQEVTLEVLKAMINPEKMAALHQLFFK